MPTLTYATINDLKEYAAGRALPADSILEARLYEAEGDIDSLLHGFPYLASGRRINVATLSALDEDVLIQATCEQAIWRLTKGPSYFEAGATGQKVVGPDYTIESGGFQLVAGSARRTLGRLTLFTSHLLRGQARGRA